jgi:molybdenum cofactor cytidylyltransferase
MKNVSVIILAAGSSSRMGQSKQLLAWGEGTLLTHAIKTALDSRAGKVYVVLGDKETEHRKLIESLPVHVVSNPSWKSGMGSSLKAGLSLAKEHSDAVLVTVCDQPFVTSQHLNHLISHFDSTGQSIVASKYGDVAGVPALFGHVMYDEILTLGDEEGARRIIEKHKDQSALVFLKFGENDIDTYEDYVKSLPLAANQQQQ